jgi:hypothetical protein
MQKWEYCVISGLTQNGVEYPGFYIFSNNGYELVDPFKNLPKGMALKDSVAMLIARLGDEGWEMVGAGSTRSGISHSIYFKRPKA